MEPGPVVDRRPRPRSAIFLSVATDCGRMALSVRPISPTLPAPRPARRTVAGATRDVRKVCRPTAASRRPRTIRTPSGSVRQSERADGRERTVVHRARLYHQECGRLSFREGGDARHRGAVPGRSAFRARVIVADLNQGAEAVRASRQPCSRRAPSTSGFA